MKRWILVLLLLVARHGTALSDVPLLINYQGQLTGTSGAEVELTFRLFPTDSGGESLWEETHTVATSGSGFSVLLGSLLPLPDAVFESENLYLSLSTEDEELVPRQRIVSVIFSMKAGVAENVTPSTITPSAIQLTDGQGLWNSEGLETGTLKVDSLVVGETPVINSSTTWVGPSQPAQSTRLYTIVVLDFEGMLSSSIRISSPSVSISSSMSRDPSHLSSIAPSTGREFSFRGSNGLQAGRTGQSRSRAHRLDCGRVTRTNP